jgi:hypothetical protein
MTTAIQDSGSKAKPTPDKEEKWEQLRERITRAQPLPGLAEVLGSKSRSEEEVEALLRRFEAGEFRNQE